MPIKFRCKNESGFDAATGLMTACNHVNIVPTAKAGASIRCEGCGESLKVPVPKKTTKATKKVTKRAPEKSKPKPTDNVATSELGRQDIMSMDFGAAEESTSLHSQADVPRCPKCGARLDDIGKCTRCKYVEKRYASDSEPLGDIKLKPAGCQLWMSKIVGDGVSIKALAIGFVVLSAIFYMLLAVGAILTLSVAGFVFLFLITVAFVLFALMMLKAKQIASDPQARLGVLSPFWNGVLYFARRMNWQAYDSKLKGRNIVDLRKAPIADKSLLAIDGLDECNVLDLENSTISDQSLRQLYSLNSLQCLVVRKTNVTHDGVVRLQQAKPKLWIWY